MYAFEGRSWEIEYARVVFPHPDSPTRPTVSASSIVSLTPSTARTQPSLTLKKTPRLRTFTRGTSQRLRSRGVMISLKTRPRRKNPKDSRVMQTPGDRIHHHGSSPDPEVTIKSSI